MVGESLLCPLRGVGKRKSKREFSVQLSVVNGARRQLTFQTISTNAAANNSQYILLAVNQYTTVDQMMQHQLLTDISPKVLNYVNWGKFNQK